MTRCCIPKRCINKGEEYFALTRCSIYERPVDRSLTLGTRCRQDHWQRYVKPGIRQRDQLKYRYLIAVEGNDFISGLAWMLFSQSVVIMPRPRVQNWLQELCLEPWVHYVPVENDWSDLEEKIMTCEADRDRCKKISRQATEVIRWHQETGYNTALEIGAERMKVFFERVKLVIEE
jgi:hypothetical protein